MISVRLVPGNEVERQLRALGCSPVGTTLETAALWVAKGGYVFTVPAEGPNKACDSFTLADIISDLPKL